MDPETEFYKEKIDELENEVARLRKEGSSQVIKLEAQVLIICALLS